MAYNIGQHIQLNFRSAARPNGHKYIIIIRSLRNGVMDKESLLNNKKMFVGNATHNHLIEHIKFSSDT